MKIHPPTVSRRYQISDADVVTRLDGKSLLPDLLMIDETPGFSSFARLEGPAILTDGTVGKSRRICGVKIGASLPYEVEAPPLVVIVLNNPDVIL